MDYYKTSEEPFNAAISLEKDGMYRMSVSMATLAIDLLLKSVLYRINNTSELLIGHNHIGILREIESCYPKPELHMVVKLSRKYFNDSRYSSNENFSIFTEALATDFIRYAQQVKDYIDTDCQATFEDLRKRFRISNL
jgi:HEPN domain-containing protein